MCRGREAGARVITDEAGQYTNLGREFAEHYFVRDGIGEYGRGDIHTNTIEGFFSIFNFGMKGVYRHGGKRLTYGGLKRGRTFKPLMSRKAFCKFLGGFSLLLGFEERDRWSRYST